MTLHYVQCGNPQGETVLFLHGGGLSGNMWQGVAGFLTDYRCIIPDLPEHGSSKEIKPLRLHPCIDRLEAIIRESSPTGQAHIVGLSLGGAIALSLLALKPERVGSIIVSGTSARISKLLAAINNLNAPLYRIMSAKQIASLMAKSFQIPAEHMDSLIADAERLRPSTVVGMNAILTDIVIPTRNENPLLVLVGQRENAFAKSAASKITQTVPCSTGRIVPKAGHVWSYENPELFAEVIREWIGGRTHPGLLPFAP